jgi:hypothetical protein
MKESNDKKNKKTDGNNEKTHNLSSSPTLYNPLPPHIVYSTVVFESSIILSSENASEK